MITLGSILYFNLKIMANQSANVNEYKAARQSESGQKLQKVLKNIPNWAQLSPEQIKEVYNIKEQFKNKKILPISKDELKKLSLWLGLTWNESLWTTLFTLDKKVTDLPITGPTDEHKETEANVWALSDQATKTTTTETQNTQPWDIDVDTKTWNTEKAEKYVEKEIIFISNEYPSWMNQMIPKLRDGWLSLDYFYELVWKITEDKKVDQNEITLLSWVLNSLNSMGIAIWGFKDGKVQLDIWDSWDSALNEKKLSFETAINDTIKDSCLDVEHFIASSLLRSNEVDKYLDSKNNKIDKESNHTKEYALRLINTYNINLVYPNTCTDVFDFIKSQWKNIDPKIIAQYKYEIKNAIKLTVWKNVIADRDFLILYIDTLSSTWRDVLGEKQNWNKVISSYSEDKKELLDWIANVSEATLNDLWFKDPNYLTQLAKDFKKDPQKALIDNINNNAPTIALFSIIWTIFSKNKKMWFLTWFLWWMVWPEALKSIDIWELMKWDISNLTNVTEAFYPKLDKRKETNKAIIDEMIENNFNDQAKINSMTNIMFHTNSSDLAKLPISLISNKLKDWRLSEVFTDKLRLYDPSNNKNITWAEFYAKYWNLVDAYFTKSFKAENKPVIKNNAPVERFEGENVWFYFDATIWEDEEDEENNWEKKVAKWVDKPANLAENNPFTKDSKQEDLIKLNEKQEWVYKVDNLGRYIFAKYPIELKNEWETFIWTLEWVTYKWYYKANWGITRDKIETPKKGDNSWKNNTKKDDKKAPVTTTESWKDSL